MAPVTGSVALFCTHSVSVGRLVINNTSVVDIRSYGRFIHDQLTVGW